MKPQFDLFESTFEEWLDGLLDELGERLVPTAPLLLVRNQPTMIGPVPGPSSSRSYVTEKRMIPLTAVMQ